METNERASSGAQSQPQKFSRYRSVRAQSSDPPTAPIEPLPSIARAPSRYHRKPPATSAPALPAQQPRRPQPTFTNNTGPDPSALTHSRRPSARTNGPQNPYDRANLPYAAADGLQSAPIHRHQRQSSKSASTSTRPAQSTRSYEAAREEARLILEGEIDRMQRLKQTQEYSHAQYVPGSEAPDLNRRRDVRTDTTTKRKAEEDLVKRQRIVQAENPRLSTREALRAVVSSVAPMKSRNSTSADGVDAQPVNGHRQDVHTSPRIAPLREVDQPPQRHRIQQSSQPDAKPLPVASNTAREFDAPVSAVNAGDRRVEVQCNQASITLPVTPSTTVKDLLNSASICMSEKVDPKTAVLLESFSQLGLERPLRRYERIRDVMNSWDSDTQNHLEIMAESDCLATGLDLQDAPTRQPGGISLQMYHSLKPGKWDKKWVNLREDGQMTISKTPGGSESTNICHLSDFDLYTPSRKQTKKLKPPKKICVAVKSQQKSAMFLNGTNFVHFFSSGDKEDADRWYKALQSWRSWYLVNVLGEGEKKPEPFLNFQSSQIRPGTADSRDSIPYQLGSFKPLLDFSDLRLSVDDPPRQEQVLGRVSLDFKSESPKAFARNNAQPPSSYPRRLFLDSTENDSGDGTDAQPFTPGGLLARSASKKSQGGNSSGRGVQGTRGKPLVDLHPTSEFTDGSLLRKMEAWAIQQGAAEPKIDREKRVEANVKVGEGYD